MTWANCWWVVHIESGEVVTTANTKADAIQMSKEWTKVGRNENGAR